MLALLLLPMAPTLALVLPLLALVLLLVLLLSMLAGLASLLAPVLLLALMLVLVPLVPLVPLVLLVLLASALTVTSTLLLALEVFQVLVTSSVVVAVLVLFASRSVCCLTSVSPSFSRHKSPIEASCASESKGVAILACISLAPTAQRPVRGSPIFSEFPVTFAGSLPKKTMYCQSGETLIASRRNAWICVTFRTRRILPESASYSAAATSKCSSLQCHCSRSRPACRLASARLPRSLMSTSRSE
mmetsp:Transcript_7184/g.15643  ORF Transcript_7184/g.15643 Transcript_7184/m.15643 type:complete len:245 (+) Transcript_7184:1526-2260(+)